MNHSEKKAVHTCRWAIAILNLLILQNIFAQAQDAGQAVVPKGWENEDSIRFGLFDIKGASVRSGQPIALANKIVVASGSLLHR